MKSRSIIAAAAAPLALGAILLGTAAQASAATAAQGTVSAVTHLNNHPDTTGFGDVGVIGPDCVWAYDNITEKFAVTRGQLPDTYLVTIDFTGSFHGFANPRTAAETADAGLTGTPGASLVSDGSVKGTIAYDVTVTQGQLPDAANLPGQSPSDARLGDLINQLFDGNVTNIGQHGTYLFTYHKVAGVDYTQVG